jgi:DNA-binding MarR family transcriptional regulator
MSQQPIGYLLWDVSRLVRKRFQDDPRLSCITMCQAKALACIHRHQGIRQVELAELLEIKPMTLVKTIDSLVEEGLVERRPDPKDRRAHQIVLTPEAEPQLEQVKRVSDDIWGGALSGLSTEEIDQFMRTLNHVHKNLA